MGEKEVLSIIYEELDNMNINYYYMINDSSDVVYPYVIGEYYEYDLQPVAVVQSDEVYNEFSPHIGESIPIDNDFDYCFYVIEDEAGSGTVGSTAVGWTVTVSASVSGAAAVFSAIFMT